MMKSKKVSVFLIAGGVITALCLCAIVLGAIDYIKQSQYRDLGLNVPGVALSALGLIAGIALIAVGIKKKKSGSERQITRR
jgi:hypothetical protein